MIKLSVSQAARRLGISRREIQQQINNGTLHTHEGYVTTDSIRLAYPKSNLYSEQDKKLNDMNRSKRMLFINLQHQMQSMQKMKKF